MLDQWLVALRILSDSGANVEQIQVDKKTMERLVFDFEQKSLRGAAAHKRWPYINLELYGIIVTERHESQAVSPSSNPTE